MEMNHKKSIGDLALSSVRLAVENVLKGGGPFGAIIVREGEVVAQGANQVTLSNDPTAHAEVVAIREACKTLDTYQLSDCILVTSCEPCPMCLGAAYWSRVSSVYYIATKDDAARAGFDDSFIYKELNLPHAERSIPFIKLDLAEFNAPFEAWKNNSDKKPY